VLYVGLFLHKQLVLTAVLYAAFVVMAVAGLLAWRRDARGHDQGQGGGAGRPVALP
jgi:nicotinamide mononucleotide transporter